MITITIPSQELFDERNETYITIDKQILHMEHSLVSVRKWEAKHHTPFLNDKEKNLEELYDYIFYMILDNDVKEDVVRFIPKEDLVRIVEYIKDPMTATWFSDNSTIGAASSTRDIITAEIIYYWMVSFNVPVEFENWHLNQLLTLIKVISIKNENGGKKKLGKRESAEMRMALNAKRRAKYKTKG